MNAQISVFVICVEMIVYLLLCNSHDCTLKSTCLCSRKEILPLFFARKYGIEKLMKVTRILTNNMSEKKHILKKYR